MTSDQRKLPDDPDSPGGPDRAEGADEAKDRADDLQKQLDDQIESRREVDAQLASQTKKRGESDELFRLIVEGVRDYAIFMLDPEGNIATWNAGAERFTGYTADEIIGSHFSRFYPDTDVALGKCEQELAVAREVGRFEEEGWRVRKDGSQYWANVVITAIYDTAGKFLGFAKITRDLTERMLAEEQRRTEQEKFRLLVENVRDYAIFMLDPQGHVATWNAGAQRFKGYEAHEIIGRHFSVFYPEADVQAGKCDMELEVAAREGRFEDEGWRIRKDGTRFWANVVITALRDHHGRLVAFGKVTRDLTERKQAEDQRVAAEERFRFLVESVKDYAIFILDPQGHIATWNEGAQRIKGYRAEEIIGSHFSRFYPEEDIRSGKCEMELEVAAREGRFEDEGWRLRKDGSRFWANVIISAVRDRSGHLVGFSKVTRDLTDRKRTEEERAARLAAEEANRTKDEFLAMLGHELRNPLAPIVSALQLLKLRGDTRSAREHQIIERQVRQMIRLVDDLLDVSRVARGKIELKKQPMDLRDALAKAVEIAIPQFERSNQHFEVLVPQRPLGVDGDEARLVQVFANLLNNAAKYTSEGGHVRLAVREEDPLLAIEVADDGVGIDPTLLPRVFDPFVQGYQHVDRADGGLGLGLTLVRALSELHGGRVEVKSGGKGQGSTFTVYLPAIQNVRRDDDADDLTATRRPSATRRRVLVVDDNEDARMMLAEMMQMVGHDVREAGDGESALALLDEFAPDVAILDIGLPGIDGYELAARIRKLPSCAHTRLLALSGYGQALDKARSEAAGFDVHLVKPVNMQTLMAHVAGEPGTR